MLGSGPSEHKADRIGIRHDAIGGQNAEPKDQKIRILTCCDRMGGRRSSAEDGLQARSL
ncbi:MULTISPECIES: hypothetical protein [unclassified Sphingobium]|uniref:hypothetical protein n=1 Tax=unclassified Sphingobium TaxID=2611147 RepID=UPI002224C036|nr:MULTISPECIES: hypothetical protein [unclassified Sphingobium]MCW2410731.1 hypothetical protein [Sphingobium sp. B8D3D]MCW2416979.1 hypothetical protein [Sphingobium sp. B8D3A]